VAAGCSSFADAKTSLKLDQINTDWQVFYHVDINRDKLLFILFSFAVASAQTPSEETLVL